MIQYGCLARYFNLYKDEISFAKKNNFNFVQLWYDQRGLVLHENDKPFLETIKKHSFPAIIHALLDINNFDRGIYDLAETIKKLGHNEVIIHPICEAKKISEPIKELNRLIKRTFKLLKGATVYLENNPKTDPFLNKEDEIEYIFKENPEIEFLLDLAHADNYEQISSLVKAKYPKMLHVADRKLGASHEHLPVGEGNIDFKRIFQEPLRGFNGKIIFEIIKEDKDIVKAKEEIDLLLREAR